MSRALAKCVAVKAGRHAEQVAWFRSVFWTHACGTCVWRADAAADHALAFSPAEFERHVKGTEEEIARRGIDHRRVAAVCGDRRRPARRSPSPREADDRVDGEEAQASLFHERSG